VRLKKAVDGVFTYYIGYVASAGKSDQRSVDQLGNLGVSL
jgi:hypothetical protein